MKRQIPQLFLGMILLWVLLMSGIGCGFHLRGQASIPAQLLPVFVEGLDASHPFTLKLRESLSRQNALTDSQSLAKTSITVEEDNWLRRVLSVDETGRASVYELQYQLIFSIHADNLIDVSRETIKLRQEYSYDVGLALAKTAELSQIRGQLYADAAYLVLQRLRPLSQAVEHETTH